MSGKVLVRWVGGGLLVTAVGYGIWQGMQASRLQKVVVQQDERNARIESELQADAARRALNNQLTKDLVSGKLPLPAAADRFLRLYEGVPGTATTIERRCPGRPRQEQAAMHLVYRMSTDPDVPTEVVDRLRREFVERYVLAVRPDAGRTDRVGVRRAVGAT